jgi:hypothetical protein
MMMLPKIAPWNSGHEKPKLKAVLVLAPVRSGAPAAQRRMTVSLPNCRACAAGGDAAQFDQQSKLQYNQMLAEAHKKDAVATDTTRN